MRNVPSFNIPLHTVFKMSLIYATTHCYVYLKFCKVPSLPPFGSSERTALFKGHTTLTRAFYDKWSLDNRQTARASNINVTVRDDSY